MFGSDEQCRSQRRLGQVVGHTHNIILTHSIIHKQVHCVDGSPILSLLSVTMWADSRMRRRDAPDAVSHRQSRLYTADQIDRVVITPLASHQLHLDISQGGVQHLNTMLTMSDVAVIRQSKRFIYYRQEKVYR
jgi:hypothetical protein